MLKSHYDDHDDLDPTLPTFDTQAEYDGVDDANNADNTSNLDYSVDDAKVILEKVPLRRGTRVHQSSTKYPSLEYVLLTNGGELECYYEAISGELKMEWL